MNESLGLLLLLLVGALLLIVPITPLILVAILSYRKRAGAPFLLRALGFSLANAALEALLLAVVGVVVGAGIGDENAGEALVWLVSAGLIGGGVGGLVLSFAAIGLGCWRIARAAATGGELPPADA